MKRIALILVSSLFFLGCQQVGNKDAKLQTDDEYNNTAGIEQAREMFHRFPSPEEMLSIINKNLSDFDGALINSAAKSDRYLDSKSQALNLGVYTADLAYLTIHGQHSESMKYFEALYELSDKLRISAAFNRGFLRRIQDNVTNADSLKVISEQAFNNLSSYLEINRNEKVFVLISMGGFVEALYLSLQITGDYDAESDLVQKIADQKYVLDNIVSYSKTYADDAAVKEILETLTPLHDIYNSLELEENPTDVSSTEDGKLIIGGGDRLIIAEEQFNQLKEEAFSIRNAIVEN